jgi:hypothetical protein
MDVSGVEIDGADGVIGGIGDIERSSGAGEASGLVEARTLRRPIQQSRYPAPGQGGDG